MRHVQGYPGSHWMPSLGDYSLSIAPAAARATANKTTMKKWTNFAGHFKALAVCWYYTACITQWRRSRALVEATGCHHWVSLWPIVVIGHAYFFFLAFSSSTCRIRSLVEAKAPINNRGMTYQTKKKDITNLSEYFMGGGG